MESSAAAEGGQLSCVSAASRGEMATSLNEIAASSAEMRGDEGVPCTLAA